MNSLRNDFTIIDRQQRLATFGLLGASFAMLLAIMMLNQQDLALWTAISALAVALPLLSLDAWAMTKFRTDERLMLFAPLFVTMILGYVSALTAVAAVFWHFSMLCGFVFVVLFLVSLALGTYCNWRLQKRLTQHSSRNE